MTKNQIDYMKLEEDRRHNMAVERENQRTNMANEAIKASTNAINARHYEYSDAEAARHNLAYEMETNRHNVESEAISWFDASSQDKLRKSNIKLNTTQEWVNNATVDRIDSETALNYAKKDTETDWYRTNLSSQSVLNQAKTALTNQEAKTEKNRTTLVYGQAGLTALDVQWYGKKQLISALSGIQSNNNQLIGAATRLYASIYSADAKGGK